jgi:hypothetical protein
MLNGMSNSSSPRDAAEGLRAARVAEALRLLERSRAG